ncbi:MAG: caspase family protein [Anaerolineae bacterium]|nr:caspase family protein [Anaerolineae bacterium]
MTHFEHGYALLIGVDENAVAKWALPAVAKDVAALREVLVHPERCAYPVDNVKVLTGKNATRQGILDGLDWLAECLQADAEATAIIYYTGHGWRDTVQTPAAFYLIPYDVRETGIRTRALRAADFAAAVAGMQPRRLLVLLDCCHAGGMGVKEVAGMPEGYVSAAAPPVLFMQGEAGAVTSGAKGLDTLAQGRGRAVLSASTGEQRSYIRKDRRMSILTYHLIEALTGHAQPQAGAREVLVSDVMSYVYRKVPDSAQADWGTTQTPDFQVSGNFPVALLLGGKGLEEGAPAPAPEALDAGDVHGPVLSGHFDGPVAVGGGEAVDLRGSQGAIYKPSGPVKQHFGDTFSIPGDGNVVGNNNRVTVDKSQTTGVTLEDFLHLLTTLQQEIPRAGLETDVAAAVAADLQVTATQARKPKPNARLILSRLAGVAELLATADGALGRAQRLQPLALRALEAAQQLFH